MASPINNAKIKAAKRIRKKTVMVIKLIMVLGTTNVDIKPLLYRAFRSKLLLSAEGMLTSIILFQEKSFLKC